VEEIFMHGYPIAFPRYWPRLVQQPGFSEPRDRALAADILRATQREERAINYFSRLIELAPNDSIRTVLNIIRDERIKHSQRFATIYRQLTGRAPQVRREEVPAPESFARGLEFAIRDELAAADLYRDIADRAVTLAIRRGFTRAAEDELRQSNVLMNMLAQLGAS
jgi:rubrerythrin